MLHGAGRRSNRILKWKKVIILKKGLGKGLGALIPESDTETNSITELKINEIEPYVKQPRKNFDEVKLKSLSDSIKQHGIIQPVIVRKEEDTYRIVAGERRWRAARLAGLDRIPVIIRDYTDRQLMETALIENLQRQDLNPIEEAEAYEKLINEYGLTQEQVASVIGKSRPAIANTIRLLSLSVEVRDMVAAEAISSGHARTLVVIDDMKKQKEIADIVEKKGLNVRDTERLVQKFLKKKSDEISATTSIDSEATPEKDVSGNLDTVPEQRDIEDSLSKFLGTKVLLQKTKKGGKIIIEYYSYDELDRLLEMFKGYNHTSALWI